MTDEKIIILVSDKDDDKHGEISVLEDPEKAERLVEALLEAGYEQERIRVFFGKLSQYQVSQRPVVSLVADGEEGLSEAPPARVEKPAEGAEPARKSEPEPETEASKGEPKGEPEPAEVAASTAEEEKEPEPVRFSSLFRSA